MFANTACILTRSELIATNQRTLPPVGLSYLAWFKLVPTRLPNTNDGQFVDAVERWVQLYNIGMVNGKFPDGRSEVDTPHLHNEKHRAESVKGIQVLRP